MQRTSVAAVAVVKDEGAYIHEWVHHNLYFGFSKIFIGINRTTDNTAEILKKIQLQYPNVYFFDLDWIDLAIRKGEKCNTNIQRIAYSFLYDLIKQQHQDLTHFFSLDVDEFWGTLDFQKSIADWCQEAPKFDIASFNWACQFGDTEAFSRPFDNQNAVFRRQIKSVFDLNSKRILKRIGVHAPYFQKHPEIIHLNANGKKFVPKQGYRSNKIPTHQQNAFILHRMARSESEYLALIANGNTMDDLPIKVNRPGFWHTSKKHELPIPVEAIEAYHKSLEQFNNECQILELIQVARRKLLARSETLFTTNRKIFFSILPNYFETLQGTSKFDEIAPHIEQYGPLSAPEKKIVLECAETLKEASPSLSAHLTALTNE